MIELLMLSSIAMAEHLSCSDFNGKWLGRCMVDFHGNLEEGPYTKFLEVRQEGCGKIEFRWSTAKAELEYFEEFEPQKTYSFAKIVGDLSAASNTVQGKMAKWHETGDLLNIFHQEMNTDFLIDPAGIKTAFNTRYIRMLDDKLRTHDISYKFSFAFEYSDNGNVWTGKEMPSETRCKFDRGDFPSKAKR